MDFAHVLLIVSGVFLISTSINTQDDLSLNYRVSFTQYSSNELDSRDMEHKIMKKHMLSPDVTCNDGSPAGFYTRQSNFSKTWIVFLEEGWCCYDDISCEERWNRAQYLMSSKDWPETRIVPGIMSNNVNENPYWWQANHVLVPYCTSDVWSGRRAEPQHGSRFSFMGSIVLKQVMRELLPLGLANANTLIISGSSAGGVGVMLNLDPIQKMLKQYTGLTVYGVTDSGWFMDQQPYGWEQLDYFKVPRRVRTPADAVKIGVPYWHSQIPSRCRNMYSNEPWKCFIGHKIYPTISSPLFVFQWLFDEFQLKNDVGPPVTKQQWDYIHKMGEELRKTLLNVTSVFAPACVSHTVLTRRDWKNIKIDSVSLPMALHCWLTETRYAKINRSRPGHSNNSGGHYSNGKATRVEKQTSENALKRKHKIRRNNQRPRVIDENDQKKRKRHHKIHGGCRHQYIQSCTWPQCNNSCPKLHNPLTGELINFLDLLKSFGMKVENLSSELGIDMDSLTNMDHEELLNMLTPQSN